MNVCFRPSTPNDGPAIVALLRGAGLTPNSEERDLNWKYWEERADWPGPRSFVLASGSEIVAHACIVPGTCAWNSHRATMIHMTDWAASPSLVGAGVTLLRHIGGLADALIAMGGTQQTRRILSILGFRPCGTATGYVRVLRPLRYLAGQPRLSWKTLPNLARGVLWTLTAPSYKRGEWQAHKLTPQQVQSVGSVLPSANSNTAIFERSTARFEHCLKCPIASMALYGLEKAGHIRGYFLLAVAFGQARLVDCWMDSGKPDDWRVMVQCAIHAAQQIPVVAELITVASDAMLSDCLLQSGFRPRRTTAIQVLPTNGLLSPPVSVRFQMLDSDEAYYHPGHAEFWAW